MNERTTPIGSSSASYGTSNTNHVEQARMYVMLHQQQQFLIQCVVQQSTIQMEMLQAKLANPSTPETLTGQLTPTGIASPPPLSYNLPLSPHTPSRSSRATSTPTVSATPSLPTSPAVPARQTTGTASGIPSTPSVLSKGLPFLPLARLINGDIAQLCKLFTCQTSRDLLPAHVAVQAMKLSCHHLHCRTCVQATARNPGSTSASSTSGGETQGSTCFSCPTCHLDLSSNLAELPENEIVSTILQNEFIRCENWQTRDCRATFPYGRDGGHQGQQSHRCVSNSLSPVANPVQEAAPRATSVVSTESATPVISSAVKPTTSASSLSNSESDAPAADAHTADIQNKPIANPILATSQESAPSSSATSASIPVHPIPTSEEPAPTPITASTPASASAEPTQENHEMDHEFLPSAENDDAPNEPPSNDQEEVHMRDVEENQDASSESENEEDVRPPEIEPEPESARPPASSSDAVAASAQPIASAHVNSQEVVHASVVNAMPLDPAQLRHLQAGSPKEHLLQRQMRLELACLQSAAPGESAADLEIRLAMSSVRPTGPRANWLTKTPEEQAQEVLDAKQRTSCHMCRNMRDASLLWFCQNPVPIAPNRLCAKKVCTPCLFRNFTSLRFAHPFLCPGCAGVCRCRSCNKPSKSRPPTSAQVATVVPNSMEAAVALAITSASAAAPAPVPELASSSAQLMALQPNSSPAASSQMQTSMDLVSKPAGSKKRKGTALASKVHRRPAIAALSSNPTFPTTTTTSFFYSTSVHDTDMQSPYLSRHHQTQPFLPHASNSNQSQMDLARSLSFIPPPSHSSHHPNEFRSSGSVSSTHSNTNLFYPSLLASTSYAFCSSPPPEANQISLPRLNSAAACSDHELGLLTHMVHLPLSHSSSFQSSLAQPPPFTQPLHMHALLERSNSVLPHHTISNSACQPSSPALCMWESPSANSQQRPDDMHSVVSSQ